MHIVILSLLGVCVVLPHMSRPSSSDTRYYYYYYIISNNYYQYYRVSLEEGRLVCGTTPGEDNNVRSCCLLLFVVHIPHIYIVRYTVQRGLLNGPLFVKETRQKFINSLFRGC
jgi:hypothetical protein